MTVGKGGNCLPSYNGPIWTLQFFNDVRRIDEINFLMQVSLVNFICS